MSTFYSLHYHLVFSTKYRKPWIKDPWIGRFHEYLGGTLIGLDVKPLAIGGVADHVHLLIGAKTTHRICDIVRELKKSATAWVHQSIEFEPFQWQDGYAIFTVSPGARGSVSAYIQNQAEHHKKKSFQEELIEMLEKAEIEYDPKYLE
jgi:putative transposase